MKFWWSRQVVVVYRRFVLIWVEFEAMRGDLKCLCDVSRRFRIVWDKLTTFLGDSNRIWGSFGEWGDILWCLLSGNLTFLSRFAGVVVNSVLVVLICGDLAVLQWNRIKFKRIGGQLRWIGGSRTINKNTNRLENEGKEFYLFRPFKA